MIVSYFNNNAHSRETVKPSSQYYRTAAQHGFHVAVAHRIASIEMSSILVVNAQHDVTSVCLLWDQNSVILMHYGNAETVSHSCAVIL